MKTIQIAPDLKLPLDTVVQRKTIVAKNRVGKSNTACAYVEEVHKAGVQTIVLDPKGDWYGIRSSFDGKGPGLEFLVMGGDFGDVPLSPAAGKALGEYLGTNHVNVVLDVSDFTGKDLAVFGADFFSALYDARKKNRTPLDLVIEEAEDFAPQQIFDKSYSFEQSRCLGALIKIAKKAGFLGIGLLLIAQRTASLNKNVLSQSDGLFIMRTTAPQDLKAVDAWLENQSTEQREYVKKHIQGLPTGTAIVWFPELGLFKQVQVRRRETFDAGFTPKVGETKTEPKVRAKVDLERLMGSLAKVVEEAKANDPALLKAEIRRLEKELANRSPTVKERVVEKVVERPPVPTVPVGFVRSLQGVRDQVDALLKSVPKKDVWPHGYVRDPRAPEPEGGYSPTEKAPANPKPPSPPATQPARPFRESKTGQQIARDEAREAAGRAGIDGPQQRLLNALADLENIGVKQPTAEQVAFLAGYSNLTSKGFANSRSALKTAGLISYPTQGCMALEDAGRKLAQPSDKPTSAEELQERVCQMLGGATSRVLRPLLQAYPNSYTREQLAEISGYGNLTSKGFANTVSRLSGLGFISYPSRGTVKANPILFLEK